MSDEKQATGPGTILRADFYPLRTVTAHLTMVPLRMCRVFVTVRQHQWSSSHFPRDFEFWTEKYEGEGYRSVCIRLVPNDPPWKHPVCGRPTEGFAQSLDYMRLPTIEHELLAWLRANGSRLVGCSPEELEEPRSVEVGEELPSLDDVRAGKEIPSE